MPDANVACVLKRYYWPLLLGLKGLSCGLCWDIYMLSTPLICGLHTFMVIILEIVWTQWSEVPCFIWDQLTSRVQWRFPEDYWITNLWGWKSPWSRQHFSQWGCPGHAEEDKINSCREGVVIYRQGMVHFTLAWKTLIFPLLPSKFHSSLSNFSPHSSPFPLNVRVIYHL